MSVEVEKEITVVIPSSKVADPEFIQQEVTKAKLRVLIEVHKGSDKTLFGLIKEFLPDVIENKALLREFNISTVSKTEFKLKLSSNEKKVVPESVSKKESSNEPSKVEEEREYKKTTEPKSSPKPKISIKPKKPTSKSKIKISKKTVSPSSSLTVKTKEDVTHNTASVENKNELIEDKSAENTSVVNNTVESSLTKPSVTKDESTSDVVPVAAEKISDNEKTKPKKKKVLKLAKKKANKS